MQDFDKEFDLIVKDMISDTTMKPSRRVWNVVSERLHPAPVPQAYSWNWAKWAGAAVACAVVAIGIFVFYPKHNIEENLLSQNEEIQISPVNPFVEIEEETIDNNEISPKTEYQIFNIENNEKALAVEIASYEEEKIVNETISEPKSQKENKKKPKESSYVTGSGENASRYFAQLEYEDSTPRQKDKASIYVKGALGSNDGFNAIHSNGYLAPGSFSETEIKEISDSNYGIPLSFGLGARFYLLPRLSIGTGLNLNILNRSFTGTYNTESGNVNHRLIYLGIPVNLYFDFVNFENIKFYGYAGAELEYCLSNKYTFFSSPNIIKYSPVNQLQYSISAGLGLEFKIANHLGLYLDPGIQYYLDCNQPKSVRTERPLIFSFDAGLRFNF